MNFFEQQIKAVHPDAHIPEHPEGMTVPLYRVRSRSVYETYGVTWPGATTRELAWKQLYWVVSEFKIRSTAAQELKDNLKFAKQFIFG